MPGHPNVCQNMRKSIKLNLILIIPQAAWGVIEVQKEVLKGQKKLIDDVITFVT